MTLEAKIIRPGHWSKIQIVSVVYGFSQRLQNGNWVNTTPDPQRIETEILTLGKCFSNDEEAEKFMGAKSFKSLFKNLEKNWA